jgi:chemotaxis protein CheD
MSLASKWVIPPPKKTLVVGIADKVVSNDPGAELVTYSLGSCLGITLYDPAKRIGGLLHVMLPNSAISAAKAASCPMMFVDTGVPRLFHALYELGADRARLVLKVAGGAQFLDPDGVFNIGERNQAALAELLRRNGFSIQAEDLGGVSSRTLRLQLDSGRVQIHSPGRPPYSL